MSSADRDRHPIPVSVESYWTHNDSWAGTRTSIDQASALDAACYVDPAFFELERQHVFETSWVCVGVPSELDADPTDPRRPMAVRQVGSQSVIIVRNNDGELRAFLNACRHRGTELAESDCTVAKTIRCPYHRWGYDLDGALIATPRFDEAGVDGFDRADFGLKPVRVDTWGCLLFVCLSPDTMPLTEWLGDLPDRMASYRLDSWVERERRSVAIPANWKLISENFQEYYHLAWVHPELAKVSRVEDHYRFQGSGMYCGQTTTPVSDDDRNDWLAMPAADGLSESDSQSGRFIALFPNVLLSVLPNHALVMILRPESPGETVEDLVFVLPPTSEPDEAEFALTRNFWVDVNDEDIDIVSRGQRGLTRGRYTPGRLSPRFEEPLHRFHNMLADRFVGIERVPAGDANDADEMLGAGVNPLPWVG